MKTKVRTVSSVYETDFHEWTQQQGALLRAGRIAELDLENLAEEIESMGASDRRELFSRINVLLIHLLKWRYQPEERSSNWIGTINEQRNQLDLLLRQSPSLRRWLLEAIEDGYARARRDAARETGLPATTFPDACSFSSEQILDPDYWPGS